MPGKEIRCNRCEYLFCVPFELDECHKKPRCPRCGSYAVVRQGCFGKEGRGPHSTGIFLP